MATELAKAYVQIVPSAKGISGSISNVLNDEADSAGNKAGMSIATKIKTAIAAAGIGKALSAAVSEGAKLEQSIGGIETLFKNSADKMKKYATDAYKTAGLSANEYMEQSTSFAASLISSLGGNTEKAADAANKAIIDMADNSNKMGTSLDLIQNAYQGFAKQNYTMLDNLKLGYGGTKTEMERLLKDAQKLTGVKYDISNLNDVYSAIHAIQENLGITGTTAKEATETVQGSFLAMKASISNLLGNMALGQDVKPALKNLLTTTSTYLFGNLLPMVGRVVSSIPEILMEAVPTLLTAGSDMLLSFTQGFRNSFPNLASTALDAVQNFATWLAAQAPVLINKGFEMLSNLVSGIINALPVMIQKLPQIITTFANIINDNFPTILMKGAELLWQLITGIIGAIPTLIANIPQIIEAIVSSLMAFNWLNLGSQIMTFFKNGIVSMVSSVGSAGKTIFDTVINAIKNLPQNLWNWGKTAISKFGSSIKNATGTVGGAIKGVYNAVVNGIKSLPSKMLSIGKDLVKGLWNGINDVTGWVLGKIKGFGNSIVNGIKSFFGIHSPSKLFNEEIGRMLSLGLAQGIEDNLKPVQNAMQSLEDQTVGAIDTDLALSTSASAFGSFENEKSDILTKILEYLVKIDEKTLKEMPVYVDGRRLSYALAGNMDIALNDIQRKGKRK